VGYVVVATVDTAILVVVVLAFFLVSLFCELNVARGSFSLLLMRHATLGWLDASDVATTFCYYFHDRFDLTPQRANEQKTPVLVVLAEHFVGG